MCGVRIRELTLSFAQEKSFWDNPGAHLPQLPVADDSTFMGFFWNRIVEGRVRDDIHDHAAYMSTITAGASVAALGKGDVAKYTLLQGFSMGYTGLAWVSDSDNLTWAMATGYDASSAWIASKFAVTNNAFGRFTLSVYEGLNTAAGFLFGTAADNEN